MSTLSLLTQVIPVTYQGTWVERHPYLDSLLTIPCICTTPKQTSPLLIRMINPSGRQSILSPFTNEMHMERLAQDHGELGPDPHQTQIPVFPPNSVDSEIPGGSRFSHQRKEHELSGIPRPPKTKCLVSCFRGPSLFLTLPAWI